MRVFFHTSCNVCTRNVYAIIYWSVYLFYVLAYSACKLSGGLRWRPHSLRAPSIFSSLSIYKTIESYCLNSVGRGLGSPYGQQQPSRVTSLAAATRPAVVATNQSIFLAITLNPSKASTPGVSIFLRQDMLRVGLWFACHLYHKVKYLFLVVRIMVGRSYGRYLRNTQTADTRIDDSRKGDVRT